LTIIDAPFASALDTTILDVFQSLQSAITQFLHICTDVDHFFIKESTVFLKVSHGLSETVYSPGDKYKYLFTVSLELHDDVELLFSTVIFHAYEIPKRIIILNNKPVTVFFILTL
jgi:hypothetical protein